MKIGLSLLASSLLLAGLFLSVYLRYSVSDEGDEPVVLLSRGVDGNPAIGESSYPSISADGNIAVFESNASNLLPGHDNSLFDIYLFEASDSKLNRIRSSALQGDGSNRRPSVSADGNVIVFESNSTNLVPGDSNGVNDVFAYNRKTDEIERVSLNTEGAEAGAASFTPSSSADGRYVVFASDADNLVADDDNEATDVFLHDRKTSLTTRVSVDSLGVAPHNGYNPSIEPAVSGDGSIVVFTSFVTSLGGVDTRGYSNVFARNMKTGTTSLLSNGIGGGVADGHSAEPSISVDGRFVTFSSTASNLVSGLSTRAEESGSGTKTDIYLYDRQESTTRLLSQGIDGAPGDGASSKPLISADGKVVIFRSQASNLVNNDDNGTEDVFLSHIENNRIERINEIGGSGKGLLTSLFPTIAKSAPIHVVYASEATNLVDGDSNSSSDVFLIQIR